MKDRKVSRPLRLLIIWHADDPIAPWQAMLIDRIVRDPQFELVGKMAGQGETFKTPKSLFLTIFFALERLIVGRQLLPYDTAGAQAVLTDLPSIVPSQGEPCADIALEFGMQRAAVDQLPATEHGVWSFTFGGAQDATLAAIDAAQRAAPGMQVQILRRAKGSGEPQVLREAQYNLKPGAILTGAFVAEKSVHLMLRSLRDMAIGKSDFARIDPPIAPPEASGIAVEIGYGAYFVGAAAAKLRERWRARRGRDPAFWRLAGGSGDVTELDVRSARSWPTQSHTMADPFLFENDGIIWVFYEAMNADDGGGWIDVAQVDGDTLKPANTALSCPYHLSFPFVFRDGEDIFMLPESQQSQRLEVWRAVDFPTKWVLHATAFEGMYLADSNLWKADDGQWWLLTNVSDHHAFQDHSSELYLFAVDGPALGSIVPHVGNPVVIGANHARNAGAIIRENGRLFRPSQNSSYRYGYGLNLMEITQLDATTYKEEKLRAWTANDRPDALGIHHLSTAGGRFVFDWSGQ